MKKQISILFIIALFPFNFLFAQIPDWYVNEMNRMLGTWTTDNKEYMNKNETDDAYSIKWIWEKEGKSLKGVLYGQKDGNKTNEYWTFSQFWDDTLKKVRFNQVSTNGMKGEGFLEPVSKNETEIIQIFTSGDGKTYTEKHQTLIFSDHEISTSFKMDDEVWVKKRSYKWIKQ